MSNITNVGHTLGKNIEQTEMSHTDRGALLEGYLQRICELSGMIDALTWNKGVDIDYLLGIEASYLIGIDEGTLVKEDTTPPSTLFAESLFPSLENMGEIEAEVIEEDEENGECCINTNDEGHAPEDATNL